MENNEPENIRTCLDEIKQALDQVINAQASLGAKILNISLFLAQLRECFQGLRDCKR